MSQQLITIELGWNFDNALRGFDYNKSEVKDALSEENYNKLRPLFNLPPVEQRCDAEAKSELVGTIDDLALLTECGLRPNVSRVRGMYVERGEMPRAHQTLEKVLPEIVGGPTIINLTIPNAALFAVRTLTVMEDQCTDQVQRMLDDGWRIVAVCPPNDTRRPTFILGHMEAK